MLNSEDDHDRPLIRNEETLQRRAWIDRALAGVRSSLTPDESGESPAIAPPGPVALAPPSAPENGRRRGLYLIRNSGSG